MASFSWIGGSADWNTPAFWGAGSVPGGTDSALIAVTGSNYVVTAGTADAVGIANLTLNASNATLEIDGTLAASGTVTLSAGTLAAKGSLAAGAITDNALLAFIGSHLLSATPLTLRGTLQVQDPDIATPSILTIGAGEVITQAGATATINSTSQNGETVVNQGRVNAAVAGGTMTIAPLNFTNQGTISAASSEALTIGGTWSNSGAIALAGSASLTLAGAFKTAGIGTITGANGVTVTGALDNSNATLEVGNGTELGTVSLQHTGVISGGTVADTTGTGFAFASGVFSGVTYQGPLNIATYGGRLVIENGLTAIGTGGSGPGTINLSEGGDAIIDFEGGQTIDNATINLNGTDGFSPLTEIDIGGGSISVLTFGVNFTVSSTTPNTQADIRNDYLNYTAVANRGTIIAAAKGGSFYITPNEGFANQGTISIGNGEYFSIQPGFGIFDNSGTLSVAGGSTLQIEDSGVTPPISNTGTITMASGTTLDLAGYYTLASLGNLVNQGATTKIDGTFDGLGGTLTLGAGTELGTVLLDGRIRNATIVPNGALSFIPTGASLQNVTHQGPIAIATDYTALTFDQGVTVTDTAGTGPGSVTLSGQEDTLNVQGQTIDNVTITFGNKSLADTIIPSGTLTIGPHVTIASDTAGALANFAPGAGATDDLRGTIIAMAQAGTCIVSGVTSGYAPFNTTFYNDGAIVVGNGDTLKLTTAIAPDGNTGTIDLGSAGTLDIGGSFGAVAGVAANQTLLFADATGVLKLRQPTSFAALIANFVAGDTIDLPNIGATQAVWTAGLSGQPGQLAITNAGSAVATLALLGDYSSDNFTVASDKAGGSAVTVTATCYAAGTRIQTVRGEVAVERLREGDLVVTVSGGTQPIRWIGHRRVAFAQHPNRRRVLPIRVARHAFGMGRPKRDLVLSPDHAVFVADVLIPIMHLVNGRSIAQIEVDAITYYHIELPRHDIVLAEGLPAESYLEAGARDAFANAACGMQLHPDFAPPPDRHAMLWEVCGYAPLVLAGEKLNLIQRDLVCQSRLLDRIAAGRTQRRQQRPEKIVA